MVLSYIPGGTPRITFGRSTLSNVWRSLKLEWITTNGLGGYSSSTVLGVNTRKYHGLLVASLDPPTRRYVVLSKLDEEIDILTGEKRCYPLGINEFEDGIRPEEALNYISFFSFGYFPEFQYEVDGIYLKKRIIMPQTENSVVVSYSVLNTLRNEIELKIKPLVNIRHIYTVTGKDRGKNFYQQKVNGRILSLTINDFPFTLYLYSSEGEYLTHYGERWLRNVLYRVDRDRGESFLDNYFQPGAYRLKINPGEEKSFVVAAILARGDQASECEKRVRELGKRTDLEVCKKRRTVLYNGLSERLRDLTRSQEVLGGVVWLLEAADTFLVKKRRGLAVIAGYHWFGEWGRDSLISLPGLALVTGRHRDAERILVSLGNYCNEGLIPNCFPEASLNEEVKPSYNSVDSSLWYIYAVFQYLKYTGDIKLIKKVWNILSSIMDFYMEGTTFGIKMDNDYLLRHGPGLTWMDASVNNRYVTPRSGKAVEVEALWFNALNIMSLFSRLLRNEGEAEFYREIAMKVYENFNMKFWNETLGFLYDTIGDSQDFSLRPNQIFTVSLDFPIVKGDKAARIVEVVWRRLWASYGLRSLDREDPRYIGRYMGNWVHRDTAYHNGTVWAWLTGPFVTAFLKVKSYERTWRKFALEKFLKPLLVEEPYRAGLGTFSEIFDGDSPHEPQGCISQAWSVAEILRALCEDVLYVRPSSEQKFLHQAESISASL